MLMLRRVLLCLEKKTLANKGAVCVYNWPLLSSFSSVSRLPHWRSRITFNAAFSNVAFARAAFSVATFCCYLTCCFHTCCFLSCCFLSCCFLSCCLFCGCPCCLVSDLSVLSVLSNYFQEVQRSRDGDYQDEEGNVVAASLFVVSRHFEMLKLCIWIYRWEVEMENGVYNGVACG